MDCSTLEDTSKMTSTLPPSPSIYSELPPPPPLRREGPRGPDPYVAERETARAAAAAGRLCPVNQHGCMYFSASEWVFCPMCEWNVGHSQGARDGALVYMGGTTEQEAAAIASHNTISVTREDLDAAFTELKTFLGVMSEWTWNKLLPTDGHAVVSRTKMHNLLMKYGAPNTCLTDEVWADLKHRFPADQRDRLEAVLAALGAKPYHPIYAPLKPSSE